MQRGLHRGGGEATPSVGAQAPVAHTIRGRCVTKLCHHVRVVTPVCRRVSLIETAKSAAARAGSSPERPPASSQDVCLLPPPGRHCANFREGGCLMSLPRVAFN